MREFSFQLKRIGPRDAILSLGPRLLYPTFSNGITLHWPCSGALAAVTDSIKPPIDNVQ